MKKLMILWLCLLASAYATTPKEIQGKWFIDQEATKEAFMNSPLTKEGENKFVPMMLRMMRNASFEFLEDQLIVIEDEEEGPNKSKLSYLSKEKNSYLFKTHVEDEEITLKLTLNAQKQLTMESSSDHADSRFVWKQLTEEDKKNRAAQEKVRKMKQTLQPTEQDELSDQLNRIGIIL